MTADFTPPPGWKPLLVPGEFPGHVGRFWVRQDPVDPPVVATWVGPRQCNSERVAHGGFLLAFADLAISVAVLGVTLHLSADFLRPAGLGDWVEARIVTRKRTRNVIFADAVATVGEHEVLRAGGLFKPIREPAPWQAAAFGQPSPDGQAPPLI
jgi:acyl-coenzyme A thioesterase PaaI-like protein